MTKVVFAVLGLVVIGYSQTALAYTEMVRHGYANCTACHVSPNGGGVLTDYGRKLSGEIMSKWTFEGETDFAYSLVKLPGWLKVGGDIRGVQIHRDTPQVRHDRFLPMQADLEVAATYGKVTAAASAGIYARLFESRKYYLNYRPGLSATGDQVAEAAAATGEDVWSFRIGKFTPAFGAMIGDHMIATRRGIGWDEGQDTFNLETAYLGDEFNTYLTFDFGRPDHLSLDREKGLVLRSAVTLSDRYQVGLSYFQGSNNVATRYLAGPFAMLGFTSEFFLLSEVDYQARDYSATGMQQGFATSNRLDYEVSQGLHFYLSGDISRTNFKDSGTHKTAYGLGSQLFPRPHIELNLLWQRQMSFAFPDDATDYATLQLHYYL